MTFATAICGLLCSDCHSSIAAPGRRFIRGSHGTGRRSDYAPAGADPLDAEQVEPMIELALGTGAAVTPVEGENAIGLERQGGVVALLRY